VSEDDVVLEVGGGLGVLSEHLAQTARHVHVVEIDERLRAALTDATDAHANVTVHWGDAMTIDLVGLEPAPSKVVANLPYGVAAGVLLRTIEQLDSVAVWV
jgi:16S rRNA (adenine1518-N6/adenine1519-N6)-dimethyltransferase